MLSPVRLSVVCLSVTFVHPTQAIEIFGNVSTRGTNLCLQLHQNTFGGRDPPGPAGEAYSERSRRSHGWILGGLHLREEEEGREGKGRGKGEEREKGERRGRVRHHGAPTTDSFRLLCVPCSGDTIQGRLHPNGNINIFRGWVTRILDKRGQTITWKAERVGVALIIYDFAMTKKVIAFREKISEPCQQTDTLAHGQHSRTSVISGLSCSSEYLPTPWQWHQYFLR